MVKIIRKQSRETVMFVFTNHKNYRFHKKLILVQNTNYEYELPAQVRNSKNTLRD